MIGHRGRSVQQRAAILVVALGQLEHQFESDDNPQIKMPVDQNPPVTDLVTPV